MKQLLYAMMAILLFTVGAASQQSTSKKPQSKKSGTSNTLKSKKEKMSYAIGYDLGMKISGDIKSKNLDITNTAFVKGMTDAFSGKDASLSTEEIQTAMLEFQQQLQGQQDENQKKLAEMAAKYKKEGEEFLAANSVKDSVITTASGLQYKILREGTGKSPADTNTVTVHYRGKLISGVVFDESYARGEPTTFQLNQVIKGWTEGLQLMKEGAKFEFYIPNDLAYGESPKGPLIPPGSALIFEVELLEVK